MTPRKRTAAGLLLAGLVLAVGTPSYVAYAAPDLAGYLLHPGLLVWQPVPYMLCAVLWLPWRAPEAATVAVFLGGILLLAGAIIYGPMLWAPRAMGGDMIALSFLAITLGTTAGVVLGSGMAFLVLWLARRARRGRATLVA